MVVGIPGERIVRSDTRELLVSCLVALVILLIMAGWVVYSVFTNLNGIFLG